MKVWSDICKKMRLVLRYYYFYLCEERQINSAVVHRTYFTGMDSIHRAYGTYLTQPTQPQDLWQTIICHFIKCVSTNIYKTCFTKCVSDTHFLQCFFKMCPYWNIYLKSDYLKYYYRNYHTEVLYLWALCKMGVPLNSQCHFSTHDIALHHGAIPCAPA